MTEFDFAKWLFEAVRQAAPVSDLASQLILLAIAIAVVVEVGPGKWKPVSKFLAWFGNKLNTTSNKGMLGLCHDKLFYLSEKAIERGCITYEDKATLKSVYEPYHELGGNGPGTEVYLTAMALPVVSKEEARKKDNEIKRRELNIETEKEEQ